MKTVSGSISIAALIAGLGLATPASPETLAWSVGTTGTPGAIDTPTAESFKDGAVVGSFGGFADSTRANFAFQVVPRVTGVLRYSREKGLGPGGDTLKDRGFDLHVQIVEEKGWRPAFAVGLRDMFGNAGYGAEYLVATKTLTPQLRASAGIGWGRLASDASGGGTRPANDPNGGLNSDAFFKSPSAPFASVIWQASDKLALKAEYSRDAYGAQVAANGFDRKSDFSFGADYRINRFATASAYVLHGSTVGFQFNLTLDPHEPMAPSGLERAPLPVRPRPARVSAPGEWATDWAADPTARPAIQQVLAEALRKDGQVLQSMRLGPDAVEIRVQNETYDARPQAIGHAMRILSRGLPASVETFTVTLVERGMPVSSTTIRRSDLEAMENRPSTEIVRAAQITEAPLGRDGHTMTEGLYPRLQYSIGPYLEMGSFEPGADMRADVGLSVKGRYELAPGLVLMGTVQQKAFGNLDDSTKAASATAPHVVRSDIAQYQKHGDLTVQNLTLGWYGRPAETIYSRVTVGYLERMYGGVSGEVLWKPVDSRFALGAELNWVKKRDYDQHFGFQDYETVTGFVSAYYDFGQGITGQIDMGRYLAKDWGATVSVDRQLANGWKVGAFATFTDMSSAEFGPGKFDKGVRLTIPLGYATGKPTLATFSPTIRPFVGDGGARLELDGRLHETLEGSHMGGLYQDWGRFWR